MITPRQKKLLQAIIDEFTQTAVAVGSLGISDKYGIKASPATIRNEMARLVDLGYLEKPHSSSGRVPTSVGIRYYLQEILDELEEMEYQYEAEIRERLFQNRFNKNKLISEAVNALAEFTNNAAIAIIEDKIFHAGVSSLIEYPEFQELGSLKKILELFENYSKLYSLFERSRGSKDIKILIGEESGIDGFSKYAVLFTEIHIHSDVTGFLAVIGPNRMHYQKVIPAMKTIANHIEDVVKGW